MKGDMMSVRICLAGLLAVGTLAGWCGEDSRASTNAPVAFFGDSLSAGWQGVGKKVWAETFAEGPYRAANYGVGGYTAFAVSGAIKEAQAAGASHKVAVLMVGVNDIHSRPMLKEPPLATVLSILGLFDQLRAAFPGVKIVWIPILPRAATVDDPRRMRADVVNAAVKRYLHRGHVEDVTVCDFGAQLVDKEGTLHVEMARDLLHFGAKGYEIWAAALKPHLDFALGLSTAKPPLAKCAPSAVGRGLKLTTDGACDVTVENRARFEAKRERLRQDNTAFDLVLLGDSITQRFETGKGKDEWAKLTRSVRALDLGIDGARVQTLLWNLKYASFLENVETRYVSILIGTNNFGDSAEDVADGIAACVREIRRRRPEAKILLMPILPRTKPQHAEMRAQSNRVNELIRPLADGTDVLWFDLRAVYEGKDVTPEKQAELLPDGVHPNAEGYARWREALSQVIKQ